MAGIDKCYLGLEDYKAFKEWAKDKSYVTPRGNKIIVSDYIHEWADDAFDTGDRVTFEGPKKLPIFNSPVYLDRYLYQNCPLKCIQDWIQDRYFSDGYRKGDPEDILGTPITYETSTKFRVIKRGTNHNYKVRKGSHAVRRWFVSVHHPDGPMWYNDEKNYWLNPNEEDVWTSNHYIQKGGSAKAMFRKITKKWKLPKGCTIKIDGSSEFDDWVLLTV